MIVADLERDLYLAAARAQTAAEKLEQGAREESERMIRCRIHLRTIPPEDALLRLNAIARQEQSTTTKVPPAFIKAFEGEPWDHLCYDEDEQ
ncbi:MAG: hypothetical protein HYV47_02315 [Candidatus Nealsonbacteria bacterium]|nr:hypothetical protein [Candidatus Nealsonbacteria bacterium]